MLNNMLVHGLDPLTRRPQEIETLGAGAKVANIALGPGERNSGNPSNNYAATKHEANSTLLASSASAQNIGGGGTTPIFLLGVQIRTALTGTLTITGFTNPDGSSASWVLPIGSVGAVIPPGTARRLEAGCTMTCSVAADGPFVLVDWRPIQ